MNLSLQYAFVKKNHLPPLAFCVLVCDHGNPQEIRGDEGGLRPPERGLRAGEEGAVHCEGGSAAAGVHLLLERQTYVKRVVGLCLMQTPFQKIKPPKLDPRLCFDFYSKNLIKKFKQ